MINCGPKILDLLNNKLINPIFLVYISYRNAPNSYDKHKGSTNLLKVKKVDEGNEPKKVFCIRIYETRYFFFKISIFKNTIFF